MPLPADKTQATKTQLEAWREMKDWIECHSPIPTQAILSSRKTPKSSRKYQGKHTKKNTIINHLNHLIDHFNHLNQIGLQDLLQRWQNNINGFCKHHGQLEADPDSRAEVLQSSSVLFTSIQVETVSALVSPISCQVSCQPEPCVTCASIGQFSKLQLLFFCQITGKNSIQFSLV